MLCDEQNDKDRALKNLLVDKKYNEEKSKNRKSSNQQQSQSNNDHSRKI